MSSGGTETINLEALDRACELARQYATLQDEQDKIFAEIDRTLTVELDAARMGSLSVEDLEALADRLKNVPFFGVELRVMARVAKERARRVAL